MIKTKIYILLFTVLTMLLPSGVFALEMPKDINELVVAEQMTARSYLAIDKVTGQVLVSKEPGLLWTPASLTKLVTALVVLDTKPKLTKIITMTADDEVGGARIATKAGVKYRMSDLFYASLVASANNATSALARSTGLSKEEFVSRMNKKAKALGAENTVFFEPTGMNEKNITNVTDYSKVVKAAFGNSQIHKMSTTPTYNFGSTNNKKYYHRLKNTNKLLGSEEFTTLGGKTGYLEESLYNFVTEVKDKQGNDIIIVLFGSKSSTTQFKETRQLAALAGLSKSFGFVLGTSTISTGLTGSLN